MATISSETMDNQIVTQYFVKTPGGGLRQLPFVMVRIDHDDVFYQPIEPVTWDTNFRRLRAIYTPPVILDKERALPIRDAALGANPDQFAVFEYHGL